MLFHIISYICVELCLTLKIFYMSARFIRTIEKNIKTKMSQIRKGEITMAESKIGVQFNALKDLDEASYEKLLKEYVRLTQEVKETV